MTHIRPVGIRFAYMNGLTIVNGSPLRKRDWSPDDINSVVDNVFDNLNPIIASKPQGEEEGDEG